jgi:hypothetical protein
MLASSPDSAAFAAHFGLPLGWADFIAQVDGAPVVDAYRRQFRPSARCPEPRVLVCASAVVADTDGEAEAIVASVRAWRAAGLRGPIPAGSGGSTPVPLTVRPGRRSIANGSPGRVAEQLLKASGFGFDEYFPISAKTGEGVEALLEHVLGRLPEGPQFYPDDMVTDVPEAFWVAELVREQLLAIVREELPHSIATRVTEWEWPRIRCEILVERDSQKGMVIGKKGAVLKQVGIAARAQLPEGAFLELVVRVDKDWQRRSRALDRLGY